MKGASTMATLALLGLGSFSSPVQADDYTVSIAATTTLVEWQGWGTSLCWWANVFGDRSDVADLLFTRNGSVSLPSASNLPALGLNIARYNIGGSGTNVINDNGKSVAMKVSNKMPQFKAISSFWLDWFNNGPASSSWNWMLDASQRAMLQAAKKRGANLFEAFANSPPWWMTNNHAVAGATFGISNNLQSWNYDQFALYLATVTKYAQDNWGISFDYVEPFNEPMANWWAFPGTQEGCHFSLDVQKQVIQFLRNQLDSRGLEQVKIAASDENSPDTTKSTLESLSGSPAVINAVAKVNTHGYSGLDPYRGPNRAPLRDLTMKLGKTLWDSEYGEGDATGLSMAESIALDINEMGVTAFVYWQALDSGGWGLIQSNPDDQWIGSPNAKYFVLAQYSRHIRQGFQIIQNSDTKKTVAAYDAKSQLLVVVTVNTLTTLPQRVTYDLSAYNAVGGSSSSSVDVWTTVTTDGGARYEKTTMEISGKTLQVLIPTAAVVTVEIHGVVV